MLKVVFCLCLLVAFIGAVEDSEDANVVTTTQATDTSGATDTSAGGDCVDATSDCKKNAYECQNPAYKQLMCGMCKVRII